MMSESTDSTSTLIQKARSIIAEHSQRSAILTGLREGLDGKLSVWVLTFAQALNDLDGPAPYLGALIIGTLTDKTVRTLFPTQDAALASLNPPDSAFDKGLTADDFGIFIVGTVGKATVAALTSGLLLAAEAPAKYWVVAGSLLASTACAQYRVSGQKLTADAVRSMLLSEELDG